MSRCPGASGGVLSEFHGLQRYAAGALVHSGAVAQSLYDRDVNGQRLCASSSLTARLTPFPWPWETRLAMLTSPSTLVAQALGCSTRRPPQPRRLSPEPVHQRRGRNGRLGGCATRRLPRTTRRHRLSGNARAAAKPRLRDGDAQPARQLPPLAIRNRARGAPAWHCGWGGQHSAPTARRQVSLPHKQQSA